MKTRFIYFVICLILLNCKESKSELTFKYSDKPAVLNCDIKHSKLFNEAIYNFEENLIESYTKEKPNLDFAYRAFLKDFAGNRTNFNNISNQHSLDIFEALKQMEGLWINTNNKLSLNYNHEIFTCIANNIKDKDLKTTFNALLTTNSLNIRMLKDVIINKGRTLDTDKYLTTYVMLELYYAKLSNVDLSQKQDTSTTNPNKEKDPHAGHNHD